MNRSLCKPWEHRLSRRQLLGTAAAGAATGALGLGALGGLVQPAVSEELKKKRKQVLFIWLDGGISQLESWDPKPNTQFGGPFRSIATSVPGVQVSELLPRMAQKMHQVAVVRSVCTKDNSHSAGVARIQRGDPKNRGVTYPYFGSAVVKLLGPGDSGLPPYVWVKPGSGGFIHQDAGFLGAKYGSLAFGDGRPPENLLPHASVSERDNLERNELRSAANKRFAAGRRKEANEANNYVYDVALALMKRQDLFDEKKVPQKDWDRYGRTEFGRHLLIGRRMLEAGITFVKVNSYGWDTHGDNFNGHRSLVPKVDQAVAALIDDLIDRGLFDGTLLIMMSEFGRTPRINGQVGRDHWPEAWSVMMAGGGLKRGAVIGKTNDLGTFVTTQEHDIGHLFHTWFKALGIDPKHTEYDNHGQPLPIAHEGCHAIGELLG
jgi:hypothetical protein